MSITCIDVGDLGVVPHCLALYLTIGRSVKVSSRQREKTRSGILEGGVVC